MKMFVCIMLCMTILFTSYGAMTGTHVDFTVTGLVERVVLATEDFVPFHGFGEAPEYDNYTDPDQNVFRRISAFFKYFADMVYWLYRSYVLPAFEDIKVCFKLASCLLPFTYDADYTPEQYAEFKRNWEGNKP